MVLEVPNFQGAPVILGTRKFFTQTLIKSLYNVRGADFYGFSGPMAQRNRSLLGIAKIAAEFSKLCNFTPVVKEYEELGKSEIENFAGIVIPFMPASVISNTENCCGEKVRTSISLSLYHKFYFVYCDFNREIVPNDVTLLLQPFDGMTWISLLTLSILLGIFFLVAAKLRRSGDTGGAIFSIFATYILFHWPNKATNNSGLIVLWSFVLIVLNNCYIGVLTSLLVAPLNLDVITGVKGLIEKNYSLTFTKLGHLSGVIRSVGELLDSQKM